MSDKEVKFRIVLDDQATAKMQEIKAQMDALQSSSQKITASTGMSAPSVSPTAAGSKAGFDPESGMKWGASENISDYQNAVRRNMEERATMAQKQKQTTSKKTPVEPGKQMIPEEWARPLRAVGAYRSAWFAGQDTSTGPMKAAAGLFILQAVADGVKKIVQILSEASPALRAEMKILKVAMNEMIRPIGDLLGTVLRPISRMMLKSNAYARSTMAKEGIAQTDLSEYYSRFFASMGFSIAGVDVFNMTTEQTEAMGNSMEALDGLFTVLGYTTLPGLILAFSQAITWVDDNKEKLPMFFGSLTTATDCVIDLKDPMVSLTNTVVKLDAAMTNFYPIIETAADAMSGVGNVLGGLGDIGKSTSDFVSGIGGYFHVG